MNKDELGARRVWARDFAILGAWAIAGPSAAMIAWIGVRTLPLVAAHVVVACGASALLALCVRRALLGPLRRVPFAALVVVALPAGALLGAAAGVVLYALPASLVQGGMNELTYPCITILTGNFIVVGGLASTFFLLVYVLRRARRRATWPAFVVALPAVYVGLFSRDVVEGYVAVGARVMSAVVRAVERVLPAMS